MQVGILIIFILIADRWWRIWSAFVNHTPTISTNDGSYLEHQNSASSRTLKRPPSIDNSDLICESSSDNSTIEIYDTLVEGTDYILVPEEIWNQFYAWLVQTCLSAFSFNVILLFDDYVGAFGKGRLDIFIPRVDVDSTGITRAVLAWDSRPLM